MKENVLKVNKARVDHSPKQMLYKMHEKKALLTIASDHAAGTKQNKKQNKTKQKQNKTKLK